MPNTQGMFDVMRSRELQAVLLTLRDVEKVVRSDINREARSRVNPIWRTELASRATTPLQRSVILPGARAHFGQQQVTLRAAGTKRPLRDGLVPDTSWTGVELGMRRIRTRYRSHSPKGTAYILTRVLGTQFRSRQSRGMVAFPAASDTGIEIVTAWVHAVVDTLRANTAIDVRPDGS